MKDERSEQPEQQPDTPDYYWENGLMVFTEKYHLDRGHCCQSGCRHCPYGFPKKKHNDEALDR